MSTYSPTNNTHSKIATLLCLCWVSVIPASADSLDLTTSTVRITGADTLLLENLLVGEHAYSAEIQLNLDGSYIVHAVEEIVLETTASYQVSFESSWSSMSHPYQYPSGLSHFSGLIGATHNASTRFWQYGEIASLGIEHMAELGSKASLQAEVAAAIANGDAQHLLSGGGIGISPGSVSLQFQVSNSHPFITLVSMIAPSPDWFIGVSALSLIENSQWVDELVVPLYAYDAGSDSGISYTSPDSNTLPKAQIARLEELPFLVNGEVPPLGTFTFRRIFE